VTYPTLKSPFFNALASKYYPILLIQLRLVARRRWKISGRVP